MMFSGFHKNEKQKITTEPSGLLSVLFKGIILGLLLSIFLLLALVAVIYFTPLSESYIPFMVLVISLAGILVGSYWSAKSLGTQGWLNGGFVGIGYVLVVFILGFFVLEDITLSANIFSKLLVGFVTGLLGGVWGVNA